MPLPVVGELPPTPGGWRHIENRNRCGKFWVVWHCKDCEREYRAPYRCDERICLACAKRRRGKLIAKHRPAIAGMQWPAFITLTRKNVKAFELRDALRGLVKRFHDMRRRAGWRGKVKGWGMWSLEVTYNEATGEYHPHLHAIVETRWMPADVLTKLWGMGWAKIGRVKDPHHASLELLKYVTKTPEGTPDKALEIIAAAFEGLRGVQPFGKIPKPAESDSNLDKKGTTGQVDCPCCGGKLRPGRSCWPLELVEELSVLPERPPGWQRVSQNETPGALDRQRLPVPPGRAGGSGNHCDPEGLSLFGGAVTA